MRASTHEPIRRRFAALASLVVLMLGAPLALASRPQQTPRLDHPTALQSSAGDVARVTVSPRQVPPGRRTAESLRTLRLEAAAFSRLTAPGALVYVPAGIDLSRPLDVLVFFHGYNGCATAVASAVPVPCHEGGPRRGALDLVGQVRASGRSVVLVVPQLAMEATHGDPGQLARVGGLHRLLGETLAALAPQLGAQRVEELGSVTLAAHSGGFVAALAALDRGGVAVRGVMLFDALYAGGPMLARWVAAGAEGLPRTVVSVFAGAESASASRELARLGQAQRLRVTHRVGVETLRDEDRDAQILLLQARGDHQQVVSRTLARLLQTLPLEPTAR